MWPPRRSARPAAAFFEPTVPPGLRIFAVGDVHGRLDLLEKLLDLIAQDLHAKPPLEATIVFLGDYIDRGPDSAGVVSLLAQGELPAPAVALRGNHEAVLLQFLEDPEILREWRHWGGLETLASYGVDARVALRDRTFEPAREALWRALPREHLAFYLETRLSFESGDYFFCHAGVRPGLPLHRQDEHDLLWIRDDFNTFEGPHEKVIVHGHTPVEAPLDLPNRIAVDTGAYASGVLSCVALEDNDRRFLSARA